MKNPLDKYQEEMSLVDLFAEIGQVVYMGICIAFLIVFVALASSGMLFEVIKGVMLFIRNIFLY